MKRDQLQRRRLLALFGVGPCLAALPLGGCGQQTTIDPKAIRPSRPVGAGRMTGVNLRRFYAP
jgi:hypothetical protein